MSKTDPSLIVVLAGDSNGLNGKYRDLITPLDTTRSNIYQMKQDGTTPVAAEPLDNKGSSGIILGPPDNTTIGSTLALCRLLVDNGKVPAGYNIIIVPAAAAGNSIAPPGSQGWDPAGGALRTPCIDGPTGLYAMVNAALALNVNNRIWFFDWNHGENDSCTQAIYQAKLTALFAEFRSTISTAARAPVLVAGEPPNRSNPALGNSPNVGVDAALRNCAAYLDNSAYINTDDLTAIDSSNGYVHFCAASHRGGLNNAPGNLGEVVTNPLCNRKYAALLTMKFPMQLTWS